jgi:putative acetyltransferase
MTPSKHSQDFAIRIADDKDSTQIKEVVFPVLREYNLHPDESRTDSDLDHIEELYNRNDGFFGVVTFQERIIGTFGIFKLNKTHCELRKMYLLPEFRGKGIGKMMLNYAIDFAKKQGFQFMELETSHLLKEAIKLYKSFGFQEFQKKDLPKRCDKAFILSIP